MAQVKFSASISPEKISRNETAQLRFVVEDKTEIEQILPPVLKDFDIVSGPNQESSMSSINGIIQQHIAISYIIKPKKPGRFIIPGVAVIIEGKKYQSNPVSLEVSNTLASNSPSNPAANFPFNNIDVFSENRPSSFYKNHILKKGEDIVEKIRKNIFIKTDIDKTNCFVGESVIATYKLYTSLQIEPDNIIKSPSFSNFSVIDLQPSGRNFYPQREKLNGREYNVYTIRKVQLYPLQPGSFELEPMEIENTIFFIKEEYVQQRSDIPGGIFDNFSDLSFPAEALVNQKVIIKNNPATIVAKPLPEHNKPVDFKGAVGIFTITSSLKKDVFTTDDVAQLTITIEGAGNTQLLSTPEIAWPEGIEGFEAKIADELDETTAPVSSRKIIEIPFSVSRPGSYTLPAISFSFFDPKKEKYTTISTNPIAFSVTKGMDATKNITAIEKQNTQPAVYSFFSNRLKVITVMAVLILLGLILWVQKDIRKNKQNKESNIIINQKETSDKPAEIIQEKQDNPLLLIKENLLKSEDELFYKQLDLSLKSYLSYKFGISFDKLGKKNIVEEMKRRNISNEIIMQLQQLMEEIEWQLYTPFANAEKKLQIYEKATELIQILNNV